MISSMVLLAALSVPDVHAERAEVGGYFRVMARPDLQGGEGRLGYWNLYGRLLNESPYALLNLRYNILEPQRGTRAPWTQLHARVEGGSIGNADAGNGNLGNLRLSQTYVVAGNVLIPGVTWKIGTLESYFGDLGLYDMRPAQIFDHAVGVSARFQSEHLDLLIGSGDSGYGMHPDQYSAVLTSGGSLRVHLNDHLEFGLGGESRIEPSVDGNRNAPHITPDINYEDWIRGEVVERFLMDNPNQELDFPDPLPTSAASWRAIGYLGFGNIPVLKWNNLFARIERLHPDIRSEEVYDGESYTLYTTELTDERWMVMVGNEMQLQVIPDRFDLAVAGLYGLHVDEDNQLMPSDHDRRYRSLVIRGQVYATDTVHGLLESSIAEEVSTNGHAWREHADSVFANTAGIPDARGLEFGDTDTRTTWQGKAGVVFNPMGPGIYSRPSLRLLYGVQYSNQNNAFGNNFVETLDQYNEFGNIEQHWHHVVALETEAWF